MKNYFFAFVFLFYCQSVFPQQAPNTENIFIITTDGFRWQELFTGIDSNLMNDSRYVEDTSLIKEMFWDKDISARRKMLMPFMWSVVAKKGQIYGNRLMGNLSNAANPYKISYPGYNEILTGYPDPKIILNIPRTNKNVTLLEYLNNQPAYHGKVVAFSSWYVFPYIFNAEKSGLQVNSAYHNMPDSTGSVFGLINKVQDNVENKTGTRYDWLTYVNAGEYIRNKHPRIVFIGLGETDEDAHKGHYDKYLIHANAVDKMISELWYFVQSDSIYKGKTTFLITTDHGRGKTTENWTNHSLLTDGSAQTWLALIGPGIEPLGEMKNENQIYQKQIAATIAMLLGEEFITPHKIGKPISSFLVLQKNRELVRK